MTHTGDQRINLQDNTNQETPNMADKQEQPQEQEGEQPQEQGQEQEAQKKEGGSMSLT